LQQGQRRLLGDQHQLANISEELLSVQSEITTMEQNMFGKVLNLEDVKALYSQHESVKTTNSKLRDDVGRLTAQVEGLSSQLASTQRGYAAADQAHKMETQALRSQVVSSDAALDSLQFEESKYASAEALNKQLRAERKRLLEDHARMVTMGEAALKELMEIRGQNQVASQRDSNLHNRSLSCRDRLKQMEDKLLLKRATVPKESANNEVTLQHAVATSAASEQRLLAEGAILRAEIQRADGAAERGLVALQEAQINLRALENRIVAEVDNVTAKMNATRLHSITVSKSLEENRGVQTEEMSKKHIVQVRLSALQQQVSPVIYNALKSENEAYTMELGHAMDLLSKSKEGEAFAVAAAQQMESEIVAQRDAVKTAMEAVKEAREEGKKQLGIAVEESDKKMAEAAELKERAKAALGNICRAKWDVRGKEMGEKLKVCKQRKEELSIANAQRDTLKQTLQSQQAATA